MCSCMAAVRCPSLHGEVLAQQLAREGVCARLPVEQRQVEGGIAAQVVRGACEAGQGARGCRSGSDQPAQRWWGRAAPRAVHARRDSRAAPRAAHLRRRRQAGAPPPARARSRALRCGTAPGGALPAPCCTPPPVGCACGWVVGGGGGCEVLGSRAMGCIPSPAAPSRASLRPWRNPQRHPPARSPAVAVFLQEGKGLQHRAVAVGHPLRGGLVQQGRRNAQQHQRLVVADPAAHGGAGVAGRVSGGGPGGRRVLRAVEHEVPLSVRAWRGVPLS